MKEFRSRNSIAFDPIARLTLLSTILAAMSLATQASAQPAYFAGLGDLPGGEFRSEATGVSADGTVIVGRSRTGSGAVSETAFRWTLETGMQSLGSLNGGAGATAISGSGSTIVGYDNSVGFRWTESGGITPLAALPDQTYMFPHDLTSDGTSSYGYAVVNGKTIGVRWTNTGIEDLSSTIGLTNFTIRSTSADGSVLVGVDGRAEKGFVWSQLSGLQYITHQYPKPFVPVRISSDGSTVVGNLSGAFAYRWSAQTGLLPLENLPDGQIPGYATDVSADGSIIVGRLYEGSTSEPWIWDQIHGTRYLKQVLISDYGLGSSVAGWRFDGISVGISDDGRTIVGRGNGPHGLEAFVAYLGSPVPEPGTLFAAVTALVSCCLRRRGQTSRYRPKS